MNELFLILAGFAVIPLLGILGGQIIGGLLQDEPKVPRFRPINVQQEQMQAISGNLSALPSITALGKKTTAAAVQQQQANLEALFPGASNIKEAASAAIQSALAGELPQDVVDLIARRAAERGISTGTAGSQFAQFGELRTLGLTSLDRINQGLASAAQWLQIAQAATPQFDFGRFMITPEFQTQVAMAERDAEFQREWVKNQIDAAFSPGTVIGQGLQTEDAQLMQLASSIGGAAVGKAI